MGKFVKRMYVDLLDRWKRVIFGLVYNISHEVWAMADEP